jgi:prepilin-type N-terminal cleavage/methylation domain-containing protein
MQEYGVMNTMIIRRKNGLNIQEGFTLIEVLVVIVVLAIGLLSINAMQVASINGNVKAYDITTGASLASRQIETLIALPYTFALAQDNLNPVEIQDTNGDGPGGLRNPLPPLPNQPIPDPGTYPPDHQVTQGTYTIYWNVADNVVIDNTKTLSVIVTWQKLGEQKHVAIQRVIPRVN